MSDQTEIHTQANEQTPQPSIPAVPRSAQQWFSVRWFQSYAPRAWRLAALQPLLWPAVELYLIFLCTLIMTRPYQDLSQEWVPTGIEFYSSVQTHHFWNWARACGWCALWNGSVGGGSPALADPFGSTFHPLVALTTLGWGVITGIKLTIVGAFFMGGIAQWWLARVLGLGRAARIWSGCMGVVGGHLAGRMELGETGMVLSTTATALVMPPLIMLIRTGSRRWAVAVGILGALAGISGHGYLQLALLLSTPLLLFLTTWKKERILFIAQRLLLAGILALMLIAPLALSYVHFLPQFSKEKDLNFHSAQRLDYFPLSLVIDDREYYQSEVLDKLAYPWLYVNYIGWIPVILAVWALRGSRSPEERQHVRYLGSVALFALWLGSGSWMPWLAEKLTAQQLFNAQAVLDLLYGFRHPQQIAGLAVIAILAIAAIGVDQLMQKQGQIRLTVENSPGTRFSGQFDLRWVLAIVLILAISNCINVNSMWLHMVPAINTEERAVIESLRTPDLQWVATPFGVHRFMEPGIAAGLKIAVPIRPWSWKDRPPPLPFMEASVLGAPQGMLTPPTKIVGATSIYSAPPGREYAAINAGDGSRTVCTAHGLGGYIDVDCNAPQGGALTIMENSWSGWYAEIDGQPAPLLNAPWLAVDVPPGQHRITFRYSPWDVPLGIALALAGVGFAVYLWRTSEPSGE